MYPLGARYKENRATNLIIFGPPGSGKGTYASRLQDELGIPVIATGSIFREIIKNKTTFGSEIEKFISDGKLVPDNITTKILKERIVRDDCKKGFILDGYPRNTEQVKALDSLVKIDAIIRLLVPDWIVVERLSSRRICKKCGEVYNIRFLKPKKTGICDRCEGELYRRIDDAPEVIKERLKVYENQTQPILEYYEGKIPFIEYECKSIDIPPKIAVAEILAGLKNLNLLQK